MALGVWLQPILWGFKSLPELKCAGSLMVKCCPATVEMRVQFPSSAPNGNCLILSELQKTWS